MSMNYWLTTYVQIFNATDGDWVQFNLWPSQSDTLQRVTSEAQSIVLKARQLGLSWLVLCYALHLMLFRPAATILIFSKRDEEAIELLKRVKGVYARLPIWMKARSEPEDSLHDWELSNGSTAKSFPSTGGRSYTGSLVIVDEAEFVQDLDALINAVKPTIDAGGQMIMISTVDKSRPESPFKRIYRAAKRGQTEWHAIFLPWHARPGRTDAWYEVQKADVLARTDALDDLHQEYPATDTEALAPRSLDKRIPPMWIEACYEEMEASLPIDAPPLPNLEIYHTPQPGALYVIGCDPAEGNPTSDDSALCVMAAISGEAVAEMSGKFQPSVLADYANQLGHYYNMAAIMVERNNHGHAVILWLHHFSPLKILAGTDGHYGWLSNALGKVLLYNEAADHFRGGARVGVKLLHSLATYTQLASIEGATLRASKQQHDDRADAFALANVGRAAMMTERPEQMLVYEEAVNISPY